MVKILLTYGDETKEGFTPKHPGILQHIESDSVDEVFGGAILEKVPDLITFADELYRIMRVGAKATLISMYWASANAWLSPLTRRAISEYSLNFTSKAWRDASKWTEAAVIADFDVTTAMAIDEEFNLKADEHKAFAMKKWNNVAQAVHFFLTKK